MTEEMTEDRLPIVFRSNVLGAIVTLVLSVLGVWAGYARITDEGFHYSDQKFGPVHFSPTTFGWLLVVICLPFALVALGAIVRGCPTLTLAESGIAVSRCFHGVVNIAWSDLSHVTIRSIPMRRGTARIVYLESKDGTVISPGPVRGKAEEIADTVRRVAARMKGERA
jgi:hypothetical protein